MTAPDPLQERPAMRVGSKVYRRDWPMTVKGRLDALWWSPRHEIWMARVDFGLAGKAQLAASKLVEVM